MGFGEDDTSERRLRLLQREFTQPARTGPVPKAQYTDAARSSPAQTSSHGRSNPPLNLGIIDHVDRCVAEVIRHARADAPDAGPVPAEAARVYDWWRASTPELADERLAVREAIIYRQGLEHAIAMGNIQVVRPHTCPRCGCWGVFWRRTDQVAVCVNTRCHDEHGMASTWTLAALAEHHIQAQKMLKSHAT